MTIQCLSFTYSFPKKSIYSGIIPLHGANTCKSLSNQPPPNNKKSYFLADYHPCNNVNCPYYGVCQASGPTTHSCICVPCSTNESEPLCDNKEITHQSICKYKFKVCQDKEEPGIKHYGSCKREFSHLIKLATVQDQTAKIFRDNTMISRSKRTVLRIPLTLINCENPTAIIVEVG